MERAYQSQKSRKNPALTLGKCLLASYLATGGALLLLALLLYRLRLSETIVNLAIIAIYALASFLAGFLTGKCAQDRRFLWGLLAGTLYFVVLALVTLAVNHAFKDFGNHFFTTLMVCAGSGMLGGMLS